MAMTAAQSAKRKRGDSSMPEILFDLAWRGGRPVTGPGDLEGHEWVAEPTWPYVVAEEDPDLRTLMRKADILRADRWIMRTVWTNMPPLPAAARVGWLAELRAVTPVIEARMPARLAKRDAVHARLREAAAGELPDVFRHEIGDLARLDVLSPYDEHVGARTLRGLATYRDKVSGDDRYRYDVPDPRDTARAGDPAVRAAALQAVQAITRMDEDKARDQNARSGRRTPRDWGTGWPGRGLSLPR